MAKKERSFKQDYLKAALAGLFCSSIGVMGHTQETTTSSTASTSAQAKVHCYGINSCKGKSSCHTASNTCAGKNTCKGQGWVLKTAEECKKAGGTVKAAVKKGKSS